MFKKEDFSFFPLQKCSSLHEIFSGKLFCSGERSDQRERMSHVPSNAETGVNRIPQKNQLQAPHWHGLDLCSPKNSFVNPQSKEFLAAAAQIFPKPSWTCRGGPTVLRGRFSNRSFCKQLPSHVLHLWEAHSMASSLSGKPREVPGQLRDEVADPRCLDLPLAPGSLWRPLRSQINVQFGRVRVPPSSCQGLWRWDNYPKETPDKPELETVASVERKIVVAM